jgi:hypothetical protein
MFFATGNNLRIAGDMTRRVLLCSIDSGEERPELRAFTFNPLQMAKDNRPKYLAAALTILRAYIVAGKPVKLRPLASFEQWSGGHCYGPRYFSDMTPIFVWFLIPVLLHPGRRIAVAFAALALFTSGCGTVGGIFSNPSSIQALSKDAAQVG